MRGTAWIAPVAIVGLAVLLVGFALPTPVLHEVEAGLLYMLLRFDQSLPLVGLGFAMALMKRREIAAISILIALGIGLGSMVGDMLAAMIEADFDAIRFVFLIGPSFCVLIGIVLLAPIALQAWTIPPAALFSGVVLGLGTGGSFLGAANMEFAAGILLTGFLLILVPLVLAREFQGAWHRIAGRIFGSWFLAMGAMLGGLELVRI